MNKLILIYGKIPFIFTYFIPISASGEICPNNKGFTFRCSSVERMGEMEIK